MDFTWSNDQRRRRLARIYTTAGVVAAALGIWIGGAGVWLLWPAVSLLLVAAFYSVIGPMGFRKSSEGHMNVAAQWFLAPYVVGAWINSRLWTSRDATPARVLDHVWIGRFPSKDDLNHCGALSVVDLTAELPAGAPGYAWHCIPMLDLVTPSAAALRDAAKQVDSCLKNGPVLVCCALGYGRSAAVLVTWLLRSGRAGNIEDAVALVKYARPRSVLRAKDLAEIARAAANEDHRTE